MALRARTTAAYIVCAVLFAGADLAGPAHAQESGAAAPGSRPAMSRLFGVRRYEYDERVDLSLDGSAIVDVNASLAALVALQGATLDLDPEARFDREAVRRLFAGPGATVREVSTFRRDGRRFAHVRLDVADIRRASQVLPLAWSRYQLSIVDNQYRFVQDVGPPVHGAAAGLSWKGDEMVAFRVHLPSRINFHNSPDNIERGNILVWEQPLERRLAGAPLHMEARIDTQSILFRTLWLFGGTFLAAMAVLGAIIWWVWSRGKGRGGYFTP